jgi:hypothetical protein
MFRGWENFFLMVGPSAASLIGLLFVVVTLTAGRDRATALRGTALYLTPTVFHFGTVLAVSVVAMAPGLPAVGTAELIDAMAGLGLVYTALIGIRLFVADGTAKPHWSDVWMYGALPPLIYVGLALADSVEFEWPAYAPYAVATMLMILLFTGIRNAWDLVTWIAPAPTPVPAAQPGAAQTPPLDTRPGDAN